LAGTLRVDLIDSFVPNLGDSFLVLDGDTTGGFATLDLDPLPAGRNWQAATDPVIVSIVPDPTDISVTKTDSPDPVQSGVNLTYTITVRNTSSVDAETVPVGTPFCPPSAAAARSRPRAPGWPQAPWKRSRSSFKSTLDWRPAQ
jgi:uncharacterized repeat protein (TIGR01451 family)